VYEGGILAASTNATDQAGCCALCHGLYHDECQGWEWINTSFVHEPAHHIHNCGERAFPVYTPSILAVYP
jgi:hypothetical protein